MKIREILFKNWEWLFENINQTPLIVFGYICTIAVTILYINSNIDGLIWLNFEQKYVKLSTFSILHPQVLLELACNSR